MAFHLPSLSGKPWHVKILWTLTAIVATILVVVAALQLTLFAPEKLVILGVAAFISVIVSRYRITIWKTRVRISAADLFGFWGVLWLGVSGGLILGAISSATAAATEPNDKEDKPFLAAADVIALYISGIIFYLAIGYLPYAQSSVAGDLDFTPRMAWAIALMSASHYLIGSLLRYLRHRSDDTVAFRSLLADHFVYSLGGYAISLGGMFAFHFAFQKFGIEFGLVMVPIALLGDFAYRIHSSRLQQKTKQISDASRIHLATVEALATAIDARDQVGIGHARRTQIYAIGLGELLGLSESEINALRTGALLHDIGKLAVPDHILNKPGRLTPAEMEKTKIHASVGASILEKVGFADPVVPTVKYHHECWNGTGYPEGLKGTNIPLTARILSVADAYDTLRGARPYRPPVPREETCNFLVSGAGTQFDPKIVSIFLKNLSRLETVIDENGLAYPRPEDEEFQSLSDIDLDSPAGYVEQIKRANREVFTLYELARDFGSSVNLHETLSLFTKRIEAFVPFDTCSVYLLEDAAEFAIASHTDGKTGPAFKGRRIKVGEGPTGDVLKRRMASLNSDPRLDFSASQQQFVSDYSSMISLPLMADDILIGAVTLYSIERRLYEEEHIRLLETISKIAADAIRKSQRQLVTETYALTDPMTGLPNARSLQIEFEKEIARSERTGSGFQLLMLDLDCFKAVNDNFGHKTGDAMLQEISRVIREQLRDYDFLARYAGDEFVALVPDTKTRDVLDLCTRIETAVTEFGLPVSDENLARVGISIGSANFPSDGCSFDEMVVAADKAMYAAKSRHKRGQASEIDEAETEEISALAYLSDHIEVEAILESGPHEESYVVEVDETHIVSSAVN
ncbi:MAG: diguanylate cyclase [Acidobacteriota bacterium]